MAGGKGKSTGGKAGPKEVAGKSQKSHSAKAGLQVRLSSHDIVPRSGRNEHDQQTVAARRGNNNTTCLFELRTECGFGNLAPLYIMQAGYTAVSKPQTRPARPTAPTIHSLCLPR